MRTQSRTIAAALSLLAHAAQANIPEGSCAIIVASRPSVSEVRLFEQQNPELMVTEVYESSNGWYALSVGAVPIERADQRLADLKSLGRVPSDSYCSTGESYLREVGRAEATRGETVWVGNASLAAPFDARPMRVEEKRFLQSALAFLGYYAGILDGSWGRGSQEALDRFSFEMTGAEATVGDAALLMMVTQEAFGLDAWQYRNFGEYDISLFLPSAGLQADGSGSGLALDHLETGLSVYLTRGDVADMSGHHQRFELQHDGSSELYRVREPLRLVTAARWDGQVRYLRSENHRGIWTSVFVSAPPAPHSPVNLVVGSIVFGPAPSMYLPAGGYAQRQIAAVVQLAAQPSAPAPAPVAPVAPPPSSPEGTSPSAPAVSGFGTAFFIDAEGHALTNAHVVAGCESVLLAGNPADVLEVNSASDLAVLAPSDPEGPYPYLTFNASPAGLNSDVTVAGYPLQTVLSGLNVTRGAVSSLSGLNGDITTMQITAPVQPGNSGGPVVNSAGRVVGIVVAKIDLGYALQEFGSVPENVNFAIRSDIATMFLSANGFGFEEGTASSELSPEELASKLQQATAFVECLQ